MSGSCIHQSTDFTGKDLLSLLSARIIPPDYESFYASLPSAAVATDRLPEPSMEEEEPFSCDTEVEEPADVAGMASTVPVGRRRASLQRSAEKTASVTAETCPVPVPVGRRRASRQRSAEKPADVTMASPTKKRVHSEQSQ